METDSNQDVRRIPKYAEATKNSSDKEKSSRGKSHIYKTYREIAGKRLEKTQGKEIEGDQTLSFSSDWYVLLLWGKMYYYHFTLNLFPLRRYRDSVLSSLFSVLVLGTPAAVVLVMTSFNRSSKRFFTYHVQTEARETLEK